MYRQRDGLTRLVLEKLLLLLLLRKAFKIVLCTTFAGDVDALKQVQAVVDPTSVAPSSCLGTWNFSVDPCDSSASNVFTCGFQCDNADNNNNRRVISLTLVGEGYKGTLSPYISNLTSLTLLDFSNNNFQGAIPGSFGSLSLLQKLDVSHNMLSGGIPDTLGQLSSLQQLSLANNQLEGTIPVSLGNLMSLQALYLGSNRLTGPIPPLRNLSRLLYLDAGNNLLSGGVPAQLPLSLNQLSLNSNQLTGSLPSSLLDLRDLEILDLRLNGLTGGLDASLFTISAVQQVNISFNHLTSLHNADGAAAGSQLMALDLSFNQIEGALPIFLMSLHQLSSLSLRYNNFTGPIPLQYAVKATAPGIAQLPLTRLYLDGNFLTGEIPSPFVNTKDMELSGSFVNNCLASCPSNVTLCQGGAQRPAAQCQANG